MIAIIFSSETPGLDNSDPHAALKAQYEADAQLYTAAWELWEVRRTTNNSWKSCVCRPSFYPKTEYRRKKHADLMIQYREDARNYLGEPWKLWQFKTDPKGCWHICTVAPEWNETVEYRRHKHADLMIQYGNEIGDKPWEHWEHKTTLSERYVPCSAAPFWDDETEYRRKVSTTSYAAAIPGVRIEQTEPAGHPHAELMIQYGEESKTNPRAWENWQYKSSVEWRDCSAVPNWNDLCEYRRKPEVIIINGIEVPKPLTKAPEVSTLIYLPSIRHGEEYATWIWTDGGRDRYALKNGLVHLTQEAAVAHAHALLSFTKTV